jgi:hypothetical protein
MKACFSNIKSHFAGNKIESILLFLFSLLAFMLPVHKKIISPIIAVLLVFLVFINIKNNSFKQVRLSLVNIALMILYTLYAIGISYTENIKAGLFDLEVKMSLIIMPVAFMLAFPYIKHNFKETVLKAFVAGCIVSSLFLLTNSTLRYFLHGHNIDEFFYTKLSPHFHPSYLALYLNFAIIILVYFALNKWRNFNVLKKVSCFICITFLALIVFLLNSKAGILIMLVSTTAYMLVIIFSSSKKIIGIVAVLSIAVFSIAIWHSIPGLKNRFMVSINSLKTYSNKAINPEEGTLQRIVIWKHSLSIIKNNMLLGVGTGDVRKELDDKYLQEKFMHGVETHLNAHNQFLQTAIAIGILGLTVLVFVIFYLMFIGIKHKKLIIFFFALIIFLNFLFESMLETQAGTVFTTFFISFFGLNKKD